MYKIQLKSTHYTKNQDNHNLNEKRLLVDANNEMTEILELSDKDWKAAIIKLFQLAIRNIPFLKLNLLG